MHIFCTFFAHFLHIFNTFFAEILHIFYTFFAEILQNFCRIFCRNFAEFLHIFNTFFAQFLHIFCINFAEFCWGGPISHQKCNENHYFFTNNAAWRLCVNVSSPEKCTDRLRFFFCVDWRHFQRLKRSPRRDTTCSYIFVARFTF